MSSHGPIIAAPLFPRLSQRFVALLAELSPEEWELPISPVWHIREVVAHLLDGTLRRLSSQRDGFVPSSAPAGDSDYVSLLRYLNGLNADWVRATQRLSPQVLIELTQWGDERLAALFASLDPHGLALWPVAWAGETLSENWFDVAREYTEKWHHAQQIFDATGRPSTITNRELMHPCLDTFMRGLPSALRSCEAPSGSIVRISITGDAGDEWTVIRHSTGWQLASRADGPAAANVSLDQDDAWKLFTKRLSAADARARFPSIQTSGEERLCTAMLEMVCVMA